MSYLYQWSGSGWTQLDTATNTTKYLAAINDIVPENAPTGIFSDMFARILIADSLAAKLIKVGNAIFGGSRFGDDGIDQGNDKIGFKLDSNGLLNVTNVNITGDSLFSGDIISGPLQCLSETLVGNTITLLSGTVPVCFPVK
jgi:hypothetical protein